MPIASATGPEWRISTIPLPYAEAVAAMETRVEAIRHAGARELVWLLEHPPLYTAGTSAKDADLTDPTLLPIHRTGRGGQWTYHGPGQRIAYVMLDLKARGGDLRAYVTRLEEWIIRSLAALSVTGERRKGRVGIWVDMGQSRESKIAALGVRVRQGVSYHGVSLNVAPDLGNYRGIVPCGVSQHGSTSLADLGIEVPMARVDRVLQQSFGEIFPAA